MTVSDPNPNLNLCSRYVHYIFFNIESYVSQSLTPTPNLVYVTQTQIHPRILKEFLWHQKSTECGMKKRPHGVLHVASIFKPHVLLPGPLFYAIWCAPVIFLVFCIVSYNYFCFKTNLNLFHPINLSLHSAPYIFVAPPSK